MRNNEKLAKMKMKVLTAQQKRWQIKCSGLWRLGSMPVISLNFKMTDLWFANIFFSFFLSLLPYTSCGCYLLSSVLNLACVTLTRQWRAKSPSASSSSLPRLSLTSPIHWLHSLLFTLKSVRLMEFVWEGVEPCSLSLYSPVYVFSTPLLSQTCPWRDNRLFLPQ